MSLDKAIEAMRTALGKSVAYEPGTPYHQAQTADLKRMLEAALPHLKSDHQKVELIEQSRREKTDRLNRVLKEKFALENRLIKAHYLLHKLNRSPLMSDFAAQSECQRLERILAGERE